MVPGAPNLCSHLVPSSPPRRATEGAVADAKRNDELRTSGPTVAIVGPTAVGKTEAAVLLAEEIGGEIISADSMAVYRGMDVGTAKPDPALRRRARFHLIDVADPADGFSAAEFRRTALEAAADIRSRGRRPIVAGGSGLYVRALLDGVCSTGVGAVPELRAELMAQWRVDPDVLRDRLRAVDPITAERLHPNDSVRIVRALELWHVTGRPMADWQAIDGIRTDSEPSIRLGLTMDRRVLDQRIEARVDAMMHAGLLAEVRALHDRGLGGGTPAMRAVGYRELMMHLDGTLGLAEAVERIKRNTRRLARRQMTWFRADTKIVWIDVTGCTIEDIAHRLLERTLSTEGGPSREQDATEPAGPVSEPGAEG